MVKFEPTTPIVKTRRGRVAKCAQHGKLVPIKYQYAALKCCDLLMGNLLVIYVPGGSKKIKCRFLLSTDTFFAQHKHDRDRKQADKEIFEKYVKHQAESRRICYSREGITVSVG